MSEEAFDPEESAERAATAAWGRTLLLRGLVYTGIGVLTLATALADWAYALVAALWVLPRPLGFAVALALGAEFGWIGCSAAVSRRRSRLAPAGAKAERKSAFEGPGTPAWWALPPRSARYWRGLAMCAGYSACFGAVAAAAYGVSWGAAAGVLWAAWRTGVTWASGPARDRVGKVLAFDDPRPPRDTPEI